MTNQKNNSEVIIVGCGVSGLTSGIRLLENQFPVTIVARELPPYTTSNVAAAIWYPYQAFPLDRVLKWGSASVEEFYRLMENSESGVYPTMLMEVYENTVPDPWWKDIVRQFRRPSETELPDGYHDGYFVEVPLIETPIYMQYLLTKFKQLGGKIKQKNVLGISELFEKSHLIVNCAGLGAKELVKDGKLFPIRGQIVRVKASGLKHSIADEVGTLSLSYIIPRSNDCVLGGTAEENNWDLQIDTETTNEIIRKCKLLNPALDNIEILETLVGLRPGREEIRLEIEQTSEQAAIIHNYGHGGAGFTLSWGCADEVVELAEDYVAKL